MQLMRTKYSFCFLSLSLCLLVLPSCVKESTGNVIQFSARTRSDATQTKTAYTGVLESGKERIDWVGTDIIRIYSDFATCNNDDSYHWSDYQLKDITASSYYSEAKIEAVDVTTGGLAWTGALSYNFYGIYPSSGAAEDAGTVLGTSSNPFSCSIPAAQVGAETTGLTPIELGANTTVYYPSMANAYMVAHAAVADGEDIDLPFEPAYTAFHIRAGAPTDEDVTISSVTFTSTGEGSTALAGAYSAYISGSDWTYGITGTDKTVTFTFDGGNKVIHQGEKVEFVIFALPQMLTGLTLDFTMGDDSHRTLKLKIADDYSGTTTIDEVDYTAGQFLQFKPCKKHYIKGLLIPGSSWTINDNTEVILRESVAPWEDSVQELEYGSGSPVVNASKLNFDNSTKSGNFAIYAPVGATWRIKALNNSDGSPATEVTLTRTNVSPSVVSSDGVLEGIVGNTTENPAIIDFTMSGAAGTYRLDFSILIGTREYSINSEIRFNETIDLS